MTMNHQLFHFQSSKQSGEDDESKPLISSTLSSSVSSTTQPNSELGSSKLSSLITPRSPPEVKRTSRRTRQRVLAEEESASATSASTEKFYDGAHNNYSSISAAVSSTSTSTSPTVWSTIGKKKLQNKTYCAEATNMSTSDSNFFAKPCKVFVWVVIILGFGYHLGRDLVQARLVMTPPPPKGHHQQPTLLSVVDPDTMDYIRIRQHYAQYEEWQKQIIGTPVNLLHTKEMPELKKLKLDKTELHNPRESLMVSWEHLIANDDDHSSAYELQPDDLIALHCTTADAADATSNASSSSPNVESDETKKIKTMEIATLAQAVATSQKHAPSSLDWYQYHRHEWVIPAFPIIRESHCWFAIYSTTAASNQSSASAAASSSSDPSSSYPMIAHSPILRLFLNEKPTNIHLARGDDPTKMVVHFSTAQEGRNDGGSSTRSSTSTSHPVAMYGIGTDVQQKVEGTITTYGATDMCSAPANETDTGKFIDPGFLHTVELTGLEPNTVYSYKVGLTFGQGVVWSDTFEFTSPVTTDYFLNQRQNDDDDEEEDGNSTISTTTYTYLVYGDQGCPSVGWGEGGKWTAAMAAREVDAREVHHIGDLSYARGAAHIWDEWLAMVSDSFATKMPLMIAVGNHEYDHTTGGDHGKDPSGLDEVHGFMPTWGNMGDDSGGECGVPTSKHFQMPASPDSNGVFWYSYDSANVHTIVLSSEHDLASSSVQYQWLEADLSSVNRTRTPWLVVELHRPLYFNEALWPDVAVGIGMRHEFEDLLRWYDVDLVLAGHVHSYFRSCAGLWHSQCDNGGPTHLVIGAAGALLDNSPTYSQNWAVKNIQGVYGYGRITVHNETWMHFEFVQAGSEDDPHAGDVLDEVWITHSKIDSVE